MDLVTVTSVIIVALYDVIGISAYDKLGEFVIQDEIDYSAYAHKKIFTSDDGEIRYKEELNMLSLECYKEMEMTTVFPALKFDKDVKQMGIKNCKLPATPLVENIRSLNIIVEKIENLYISHGNTDPLPPANHTVGLNLKSFGIQSVDVNKGDFFVSNPGFFEPLDNLTVLMVWGTRMPMQPAPMHLKALSLRWFTPISKWEDYCLDLEVLSLISIRNFLPKSWPENCSKLTAFELDSMETKNLQRVLNSNMSYALKNLRRLHIRNSDIPKTVKFCDFLPLFGSEILERVDLSANWFTDDQFDCFPVLKNLTYLNLSGNELTGWFLVELAKKIPNIRDLDLSYNNLLNLFCDSRTRVSTVHFASLERLSLEGMESKQICFQNIHFPKLQYLNLMVATEIKIERFKLNSIPTTNASHLEINFQNRYIEKVVFFESDYKEFKKISSTFNNKTKITITKTTIECDCQNYWFTRAIREFSNLITMKDAVCKRSNRKYEYEDIDKFDCSKYMHYSCEYRGIHAESFVIPYESDMTYNYTFECHSVNDILKAKEATKPDYNVVEMDVSDANIRSFKDVELLASVKRIDLRGNRLSRLDENDTSLLFSVPERIVFLSRNLLICDCDSETMLDALHGHRNQVVDFENIICADSNRSLSTVTSYEVCRYGPKLAAKLGAVVGAAIFIMAIVIWRYRFKIRIYFYSRGWCLFCFTEDEDSDKPYDAFVSFAHGDWDYVTEELLPKLEGEPNLFRTCVHYRDWRLGDWIPAQIMRSVSLSKRTIIVLSRNFVQSLWGSLEFRYAAASSANEPQPRLLVLILDDVLDEALDAELLAYLKYNTYLRCDDPWFWEKLRYAMPHLKRFPDVQEMHSSQHGHGVIDVNSREVNLLPLCVVDGPIVQSS